MKKFLFYSLILLLTTALNAGANFSGSLQGGPGGGLIGTGDWNSENSILSWAVIDQFGYW